MKHWMEMKVESIISRLTKLIKPQVDTLIEVKQEPACEDKKYRHMLAFCVICAGQGVLQLKPHSARAGEQEPTSRLLLD